VVQDPEDALFPEMPQNAMAHVEIDFIVKLSQIPPLLTTLVSEPLMEKVATGTLREEAGGHDPREEGTLGMHSVATDFTCPECHGAIREQRFGTVLQYSCRIGHTYTGNTMLEAHVDAEENALWGAVVALEEGAELSKRMAQVAPDTKEVFERQAELRRAHAKALRNMMAEISLSRKT
jgi:two-component system chemotaxis response regulator CheB